MLPDLLSYDVIVVNSSAGKDSQAMLDYVVEQAALAGVRERVVVLHCDLGLSPKGQPIEWPGTKELAEEHAVHYGLRFLVAKRGIRGFLEEVQDRGAWPSSTQRYCTSYFKRDQGARVLTTLANKARGFLEQVQYRGRWPASQQRFCTSKFKQEPGAGAGVALASACRRQGVLRPRLLNCFGFRAEESPRRRKLLQFAVNTRATNSRKQVEDWLPIQEWTEAQVWERIRQAGTRYHPAYDLGMPRLSCSFCIFAPKAALMIAARARPELFEEYLETERQTGHSFRLSLPLAEVKRALDAGEQAGPVDGLWNM